MRLSGKDATEEYDPIHPPGTLEENLPPHALLGQIDSSTLPQHGTPKLVEQAPETPPSMEDVLNLDEMEEIATKQISNKGWAYYYSAGDDLLSKRLNTEAYRSILLRPRIFVDCEQCDISTNFLGHRVGMPIFVSPAAMARLAHPSGEVGIAKACSRFGTMQLISNNASMTPEQIVADAPEGQIFGWQIYVQLNRKKSEDMLARINRLSHRIKLICLTLDAPVPGKREHDERQQNVASNLPVSSALKASSDSTPMKGGVGRTLFQGTSPKLTWAKTIPWLAKHTLLPIILKGIQTHEDAYLASLYSPQVRGIVLSNHGGRALDTAPPAVHTLLEIRKYCPEVFDKLQVFVDGGIKRGTDVVKALALGASGVGIGRAALWGLGAGGQAGVERTLESRWHGRSRSAPR